MNVPPLDLSDFAAGKKGVRKKERRKLKWVPLSFSPLSMDA